MASNSSSMASGAMIPWIILSVTDFFRTRNHHHSHLQLGRGQSRLPALAAPDPDLDVLNSIRYATHAFSHRTRIPIVLFIFLCRLKKSLSRLKALVTNKFQSCWIRLTTLERNVSIPDSDIDFSIASSEILLISCITDSESIFCLRNNDFFVFT